MIATLLLLSTLAAGPDLDGLSAKAKAAAAKSDWKAADEALSQLVQARPNDAETLYSHAAALSRLGKKEPALKELQRALLAGFAAAEFLEADPDLERLH